MASSMVHGLLFYFLFLLPLCYYFHLSSGQQDYIPFDPSCSIANNYTDGSTYQANLEQLLGGLPRSAMHNSSFATDIVGTGSDQVFGLVMCFASSDIFNCETCLNQAKQSIIPFCPRSRTVSAGFSDCLLRYSDTPFFSVATLTGEFTSPPSNFSDISNTDGAAELTRVRTQLMNELISNAASSPVLVGAGNRTFNSTATMYGLVQCTRDLPGSECDRCLRNFVPKLPQKFPLSSYGVVVGYSCYMRYDLTPFDVNMPPLPSNHGKKGRPVAAIIGIAVAAALLALLLVVVVTALLVRRARTIRRHPPTAPATLQEPQDPLMSKLNLSPRRFTLVELQAATQNFSCQVGSGAFGVVYKGKLADGPVIAVKELKADKLKGFEKESEILGSLSHKNIVRLLGYCHERERYFLCCEFVEGGNLEDHIFGDKMRFDWTTRFNIIRGVCSGLVYLHEDSHRCIVHLDLKPSNILLHKKEAGSVEPKLSDFGISKFLDTDKKYLDTVNPIGSYGYMAPECYKHGKVSPKADVYSFGILILEMVTGQRDRFFSEGNSVLADKFIEYVRRQWKDGQGNIKELRDQILEDKFSVREMHQCIEIALQCVQNDPAARPDARTIYHRMFDGGHA